MADSPRGRDGREPQPLPQPASEYGVPVGAVVAAVAGGQTLYRLVRRDPPDEDDFLTNRDKGRPPFAGQAAITHAGLSMFETADHALRQAKRYPKIVAAVVLERGSGSQLAKTYGAGHYTVWGQPHVLASAATVVHRDDGD